MFRFEAKIACRMWRNSPSIMAIYVQFYMFILTKFILFLCETPGVRPPHVHFKQNLAN
jgi:hypothetical protein